MKILAVEDNPTAQVVLRTALVKLGHEVIEARDGQEAWAALAQEPIRLVVSDWMMPRMDGLELCQRVRRSRQHVDYTYFILLTALDASHENRRQAADAGVDDFLTKPLDATELWLRLRTAERIIACSTRVRQLERLLPICSYCKKVRDDKNDWQQLDSYIREHTESEFSHSICPDCYQRIVQVELKGLTPRPDRPGPTA